MVRDEDRSMGDRLADLLRDRGKADRGKPYEQKELAQYLTGEVRAPNGKYYSHSTSSTAINRMVRDGVDRFDRSLIKSICEILAADPAWLLYGMHTESGDNEQFVTDEANRVGSMVDGMDLDMREITLAIVRQLYNLDQERRDMGGELFSLLSDISPDLSGDDKIRARSILRKINIDDALG